MTTIEEMNANVGPFVAAHVEDAKTASGTEALRQVLKAIDEKPDGELAASMWEAQRVRQNAKERAIGAYLSQQFSAFFPRVSDELILRKRWLRFERGGRGAWELIGESFDVPEKQSFQIPRGRKTIQVRWVSVPLLLRAKIGDGGWGQREQPAFGPTIELYARAPEVPFKARECYRAACAAYLRLLSESMLLGDVGTEVFVTTTGHGWYTNFGRGSVAWIPLLSEITVRSRHAKAPADPALLLEIQGNHHLVTHWDAPGERPLEAILREYTEGRFVPAIGDAADE